MRLMASGASTTGPAHIQDNLPNQDAIGVHGIRNGWCITVCDGLGSRRLSHIGSAVAAKLVKTQLRLNPLINNHQLCQQIRKSWLDRVNNQSQDYETTCLWAHISVEGIGMAAQTGDGLLLVKSNGQFHVVTDERNIFSNQTTTLSQAMPHLWNQLDFELKRPGDGVLLMTDGISDDLISNQLELFFDAIYRRLKKTNKRRMRKWLTQELLNWSTPKHGDDKSIAGIFRVE